MAIVKCQLRYVNIPALNPMSLTFIVSPRVCYRAYWLARLQTLSSHWLNWHSTAGLCKTDLYPETFRIVSCSHFTALHRFFCTNIRLLDPVLWLQMPSWRSPMLKLLHLPHSFLNLLVLLLWTEQRGDKSQNTSKYINNESPYHHNTLTRKSLKKSNKNKILNANNFIRVIYDWYFCPRIFILINSELIAHDRTKITLGQGCPT